MISILLQEKRDNRRKTGTAGGKKCRYDDADKLIFEIMGKEAPTLDGLEVPETSGNDTHETVIFPHNEVTYKVTENNQINNNYDQINSDSPVDILQLDATNRGDTTFKKCRNKNKNDTTTKSGDSDLTLLKKELAIKEMKLVDEKIQIAIRQRYKLDLELYKLEKELNLPLSEFTEKYGPAASTSVVNNSISDDILIGFENSPSFTENMI